MAPLIFVPTSGVAHQPNNKHDDRYAENGDDDVGHCAFLPNLSKANAAAYAFAANPDLRMGALPCGASVDLLNSLLERLPDLLAGRHLALDHAAFPEVDSARRAGARCRGRTLR